MTLIEAPPVHTPSADEFRAVNDRLLEIRRSHGSQDALDEFLTLVIGSDWRQVVEQQLPGSAVQMLAGTSTFFDNDLPALLTWQFEAEDAARIKCPVLYIGGTHSGPGFAGPLRSLARATLSVVTSRRPWRASIRELPWAGGCNVDGPA